MRDNRSRLAYEFEAQDLCSLCNGPLGILGVLGNTEHMQCRNCGAEFSRRVADDYPLEES